jgi:hypothetical protein
VTLIDKETSTRFPLEILFVDDNPINRAVGLKVSCVGREMIRETDRLIEDDDGCRF